MPCKKDISNRYKKKTLETGRDSGAFLGPWTLKGLGLLGSSLAYGFKALGAKSSEGWVFRA